MKLKQLSAAMTFTAFSVLCAGQASASYVNYGGVSPDDFTLNSTAWTLGSVRSSASGSPAPGSATWSVMGSGLVDASGVDAHSGNSTSLLASLYVGGVDEATTINLALNLWSAVSGFINLGQVADGGGNLGAAGAAGGTGQIRVGSIFIDGALGSNVLAHAFNPCNATLCGAGGNIGGDVHFDNSNSWSDNAAPGTIDFFTVALHELGHALGLGHSTVPGSVMEAFYGGSRRTLTADDIAGIQSIYGVAVAVPEPSTYVLMALGAIGVTGWARRRAAKA
jgi:hypothetical protein